METVLVSRRGEALSWLAQWLMVDRYGPAQPPENRTVGSLLQAEPAEQQSAATPSTLQPASPGMAAAT